jgi:branched-chain amino acid aminotransferase
MLEFEILKNANPMAEADRALAFQNLGFGTLFSDHMAVIHWSADKGWHSAQVTARAPFALDPASSVLHYAQEIFEGMKAYRAADGKVVLFRPDQNAKRFNASARRLAMPELPEEDFLAAIEKLVAVDRKWVPEGNGGSLYLRPFMFANESFLGVRPSKEYIFCVIASPVGPYFQGGAKPVKIWVSEDYTRAAVGGTGAAKCGGNYAASLIAQAEAGNQGCDQVLFLDAAERKWIEELGGMNIFFVFNDGSMVTPPLGTILPGITRNSILTLAKDNDIAVEERPYAFDELQADVACGRLVEAFACGTAAVVAGIGELKHNGGSLTIGTGETGAVTTLLRNKLVGIQTQALADSHGWLHTIPV